MCLPGRQYDEHDSPRNGRGQRVTQCADQPPAPQHHLRCGAARHVVGGPGPDHRRDCTADRRRRPRRSRTPVVGCDELSAGLYHRHRRRRQARRSLRPQDRLPSRGGVLPRRLCVVRVGRIDDDARGIARLAGPRWRRAHGHGDGRHRRGHPVAGTRPLSRRTRRRVRRHHSHRPAARRILHRSPHLALGLLDQHSGGDRGVRRRCRRHPDAGPQQPSRHRLRRNRFRRARRIRTDAGHQLGRQYLCLVVTDDHRAVRGLGSRAGHLRVGGNPCGGADSADPAVRQPSVHGVLHPRVHRRVRDVGRADVPADVHAIRQRRLGDGIGTAHPADGRWHAHHVDRQRQPRRPHRPVQGVPRGGHRHHGGGVRAPVPDGRHNARPGSSRCICSCSERGSACACRS